VGKYRGITDRKPRAWVSVIPRQAIVIRMTLTLDGVKLTGPFHAGVPDSARVPIVAVDVLICLAVAIIIYAIA